MKNYHIPIADGYNRDSVFKAKSQTMQPSIGYTIEQFYYSLSCPACFVSRIYGIGWKPARNATTMYAWNKSVNIKMDSCSTREYEYWICRINWIYLHKRHTHVCMCVSFQSSSNRLVCIWWLLCIEFAFVRPFLAGAIFFYTVFYLFNCRLAHLCIFPL